MAFQGHHSRQFSTSETNPPPTGKRRPWALILSFCAGGVLSTFALRSRKDSEDSETITPSARTPAYGNPTDFQTAIHELQEAFPADDRVTTDPDDLHDHGFSLNDYHPGKISMIIIYSALTRATT